MQRQDDQATPPSGYDVPAGEQETVQSQQPPPPPTEEDRVPTPWELKQQQEERRAEETSGEAAPPSGDEEDEYRWHTERTARSEEAETDAVEFIDVVKAFGRNTVLNGLNLGLPEGQISMI